MTLLVSTKEKYITCHLYAISRTNHRLSAYDPTMNFLEKFSLNVCKFLNKVQTLGKNEITLLLRKTPIGDTSQLE